ncbi:MAG TPA: amidohydrolase family protein [Candidatus Binataceae bacterium]|nr:amidohydrolase family protein [Candidatus Binataceae bacterium]
MTDLHRIDVHHHPSPPSYLSARFERDKQYAPQKNWSVARSLEDMDRGGVATAMLSLPHSVQIWPGEAQDARRLARDWNEFMTTLAREHRGRFGVFAALPILDIEGSLREIEYALDTLKADGIALMTNIGDKWLGDPHYAPIFDELNRRGAIVYTHPVAPNCCRDLLPEFNDSVIEYGADTTRAIGKLLYSGSAARYPRITFIFSHAGGTLPYLAFRFLRHYRNARDEVKARMPEGLTPALNKFYYDTANTSNVYAMASFTKLIALSQLMFGTDFPFGHADHDAHALAECGFSAAEIRAIECENAYRLWPRLKPTT